jgi:hypothetical protein
MVTTRSNTIITLCVCVFGLTKKAQIKCSPIAVIRTVCNNHNCAPTTTRPHKRRTQTDTRRYALMNCGCWCYDYSSGIMLCENWFMLFTTIYVYANCLQNSTPVDSDTTVEHTYDLTKAHQQQTNNHQSKVMHMRHNGTSMTMVRLWARVFGLFLRTIGELKSQSGSDRWVIK